MLADNLDPGALADERHQGVAGQKALGMMYQADLMPIHRVHRLQQLEIAKMSGQHQDPAAGMAALHLLPQLQPFVAHLTHHPATEKSPQADVLRAAASEIDVGLAQDAAARGRGQVGEGYREILQTDARRGASPACRPIKPPSTPSQESTRSGSRLSR